MNSYVLWIPQTKTPTNMGLDVVERVNLFQQYHLLGLSELTSLYGIYELKSLFIII